MSGVRDFKNHPLLDGSELIIGNLACEEERLRSRTPCPLSSRWARRECSTPRVKRPSLKCLREGRERPHFFIPLDIITLKRLTTPWSPIWGPGLGPFRESLRAISQSRIVGRFGGDEFFAYIPMERHLRRCSSVANGGTEDGGVALEV